MRPSLSERWRENLNPAPNLFFRFLVKLLNNLAQIRFLSLLDEFPLENLLSLLETHQPLEVLL